ncbi:MAG: radical SAM protein [Deltaproteobacteria bacterium]|nr:radical SAM protein [Deltaproteobacteria bacterium]
MSDPLSLRGLEQHEAIERLATFGARPREARKLWCQALAPEGLPGDGLLPQVRREVARSVAERQAGPSLRLASERIDPADGFAKLLFELERGGKVEAVRIPIHGKHHVVCVSSQTSCALDCAFCATAGLGTPRNLLAEEMVEQVLEVRARAELPVKGVVFMGMGEPLANLDAVLRAARILSTGGGPNISGGNITISTAGLLPGLRRLEAERVPFRLILSVGSAIPEKRRQLMPIEESQPLREVFPAAARVAAGRRRRLTLAYVMVAGFNTGEEDARALKALVGDTPVILDLIDVNDASGRFLPPDEAELDRFRDALRVVGAPVSRRYSGGKNVEAACGMLAGKG